MSAGDEDGQVARAALALVGVRFRLHGRDPATGLDCVGVAAQAYAAAGWAGVVPTGYALRGGDAVRIAASLDRSLARADRARPGDLLLVAPGAGQLHLAIRTRAGIVHADAALRRVALRPGEPPWPILGAWRNPERLKEEQSWQP